MNWNRDRGVIEDLALSCAHAVERSPWWQWRARWHMRIIGRFLLSMLAEGDRRHAGR